MNAWDKRDDETAKSYQAFCDYRDMGVSRSLRSLLEIYVQRAHSNPTAKPPTNKDNTLFDWSRKYNWVARSDAWDVEQQRLRDLRYATERTEQREQRQKIVQGLSVMLAKVMKMSSKEKLKPAELNSLSNAAAKILDQSRQEFNDLPTQRNDTTINGNLGINKGYVSISPDDWDADDVAE